MEDLFKGIRDIYFLSSYYLNREKRERKEKKRGRQKVEYTWKKFFEILGIWSSPRVVKEEKWISIVGNKEYSWIEKEYSPHNIHEIYGDSHSKDVKRLIEYCTKIDNQREIKKRMTLLWENLEKHWKLYKERQIHCSKYRYSHLHRFDEYYYTERNHETSSFLEFLRNASWIPRKDGGFYKPEEVFIDTKKNRFLLEDKVNYTDLKANDTFLKDIGIRIEPEIDEVIDHMRRYKEEHTSPRESKIEKMRAVYGFLRDKINNIEDPETREIKIQEIKKTFTKNELLYLPRKDSTWWKPSHVFWRDFSKSFGVLRGYIEHNGSSIYDSSLKDFLLLLGVVEKPLLKECFEILEGLKSKGDLSYCKKFIPMIYVYVNEMIKQGIEDEINWERTIFLSEEDRFLTPSKLYYSDNEEYKNYFGGKIEIFWLPFSWSNIRNILQIAGFKRLDQNITVVKKFGKLNEIDGDVTNQLIQRLSYVKNYLKKRKVELFEELQREDIFQSIRKLQAYETQKIFLDYILKIDGSKPFVINNIEKEAYFSNEENRIYKSNQTNLFSTTVAKELSKLFSPCEDDVLPFLDSLFSTVSEDELNEKLRHFGVQITDISTGKLLEDIKIIPSEEESEQEVEPEKEKEQKRSLEDISERPQLPKFKPDVGKFDLIDPNEFVFDVIEGYTPYKKTEGIPDLPPRKIKLKKGYRSADDKKREPRRIVNREDAEGIALEITMRLEEIEDREPDDRHNQPGIGYDIYSKTKNNEKRFIEVKHFRGEPGTWELTPHQWEKAKKEREKYFVYIVSGLREENIPIIEIIQNPVELLTPDLPAQKKFSNWKNGVKNIVKFRKV